MENIMIIGIAGGTGSGKTTLTQRIKEAFHDNVVVLSHDYYYKSNSNLSFEERTKLNYDHPNAFDTDLLVEHMQALREGKTIHHPVYSFVEHTRLEETVEVKPAKVIILEGILIFENKELCDLMDIKVLIDVILNYGSIILAVLLGLVTAVTMIVEVVKRLLPKVRSTVITARWGVHSVSVALPWMLPGRRQASQSRLISQAS